MENPDTKKVWAEFDGSAELKVSLVRDIGRFTVALFASDGNQIRLAGTGTLLTVSNSHYILTAAHVWEEILKTSLRIGVTLEEGINQKFFMDTQTIVPCGPTKPAAWDEWGPDIILLRVPSYHAGSIGTHRTFYQQNVDGQAPPNVDHIHFGVLMGTPEVLGNFTPSYADVQIEAFHSFEVIPRTKDQYDYFDVGVDISSPGSTKTFEGVSGGGLWRVALYRSSTGGIDWALALEGVAFFQFPAENERRVVRCHGPKSVLAAIATSETPSKEN